ncbi:MAG: transposase [Candidatus Omnitrophica bacterium]|nr:transposase [Candidatus Omnitrophota bacterium]
MRTAKRPRRKIGTWADFVQAYPDLAEVVIDATEQPRRRPPRRSQRRWYSGQRKRPPLKTPLTVSRRGRMLHVSAPAPGRVHAYALFKQRRMANRLPRETTAYLDRGDDGAATDCPTAQFVLPIKRRRNKRMRTHTERRCNHWQARQRIIVEHLIARLKKYQLLAQVYRHRILDDGQRVRNIAALVNFRTPLLATA